MSYEEEEMYPPEDVFNAPEYARLQILRKRIEKGKRPRKKGKPTGISKSFPDLTNSERRRLANVKSFAWNVKDGTPLGSARLGASTPDEAQRIDHLSLTNDLQRWRRKFKRWIERRRQGK